MNRRQSLGGGARGFSPLKAKKYLGEGFTLAEVLITLGVIGIVAALTLPTVIQHYKKQEASTRLKKFYTTMVQAIMLSENVNGSSKDWAKPAQMSSGGENSFTGEYDYEVNNKNAIIFFNQYFAPYLKYLKISEGSFADDKKEYSKIYFADGSVAAMKIGSCIDFQFDVNGEKKPNEYGRDIFVYFLCPSGLSMLDKNITFGPGSLSPFNYSTRENAWQACKSNNKTCSVLLQYYDNWEFKDDYPYKL